MTYADWILQKFDKDPALRFLYNQYGIRPPIQCDYCRKNHRRIQYVLENDLTEIVYGLCQADRVNNLKMMNYEFKLFNLGNK